MDESKFNDFLNSLENLNEFNKHQIRQIRKGFEKGLSEDDIRKYADPHIKTDQMKKMIQKLTTKNQVNEWVEELRGRGFPSETILWVRNFSNQVIDWEDTDLEILKSVIDKDLSIIEMRSAFYAIKKYGNDIDASLLKEFLKNEHIEYKSFVWSFIQGHEKFSSESDIETFIEVTCNFMEVIETHFNLKGLNKIDGEGFYRFFSIAEKYNAIMDNLGGIDPLKFERLPDYSDNAIVTVDIFANCLSLISFRLDRIDILIQLFGSDFIIEHNTLSLNQLEVLHDLLSKYNHSIMHIDDEIEMQYLIHIIEDYGTNKITAEKIIDVLRLVKKYANLADFALIERLMSYEKLSNYENLYDELEPCLIEHIDVLSFTDKQLYVMKEVFPKIGEKSKLLFTPNLSPNKMLFVAVCIMNRINANLIIDAQTDDLAEMKDMVKKTLEKRDGETIYGDWEFMNRNLGKLYDYFQRM